MFLFPIVYITSFIYGVLEVFRNKIEGFLVFTVVGLPIYNNSLSVTYMYGFAGWILIMQSFKELLVFFTLLLVISQLKSKPRFHKIDILVLIFLGYTLIYAFLPIGSYNLTSRLLALKNLSFFALLYFIGRFCRIPSVNIRKIFSFTCIVIIIAAIVGSGERILYQHLHSFTGYADYNAHFFNGEVEGNYGLAWTFETESGGKRFGSIFSNPLDFASATVLSLAIILSLITYRKRKRTEIKASNFELISLFASFLCILFAASRASFAGYFLLIYAYGWIIGKRTIIRGFHIVFICVTLYILFFLKGDMFDFIMNTIKFQNESSIGHVLEWMDGVNAMIVRPLGLGLGESGRVAISLNQHTGGENQLIIIGVQAGVPIMLLYIFIYIELIRTGLNGLKTATGKKWKVLLAVVLIKISLIIPTFTSYIDSYIYLGYLSWFLCGYMINLISKQPAEIKKMPKLSTVPVIN